MTACGWNQVEGVKVRGTGVCSVKPLVAPNGAIWTVTGPGGGTVRAMETLRVAPSGTKSSGALSTRRS